MIIHPKDSARDNGKPVKKFIHKGLNRGSMIESHGPSGKVRGTMPQLVDRYTSLGRDAMREGEGVIAEGFFQHAEHYRRLLSAIRRYESPLQGGATSPKDGEQSSCIETDDEGMGLESHTEDE